MGFGEGDPFEFDARFDFSNACFELEDIFDKVHDSAETPLEGSRDVFVHEESPSLGFDDCAFPDLLDHSHVFPVCLQPSPSPEYDIVEPIGNPKIRDSNVDLGYEANEFNVLGGNDDDYASLGYLKDMIPQLTLIMYA